MNSIRELFDKVLEYEGESILTDLLIDWVEKNHYDEYLNKVSKSILGIEKSTISETDSWELYALSRVLDILSLRFQRNNNADESEYLGPPISKKEYEEFIKSLGLQIIVPKVFIPFNCEIMEAKGEQKDFEILECLFPAVKLAKMMIKRAGTIITLNKEKYDLKLITDVTHEKLNISRVEVL